MASAAETGVNRRNTDAFIQADPVTLTLMRRGSVPDGDGGTKNGASVPVVAQTFRLIPQSDVMPQVQTPDGAILTPTYVLLGRWDCDMERWDQFSIGPVNFIIVSPIRPDFRTEGVYERKADVARR